MTQFFVDLNIEKRERFKLCTTIHQLEDELAQLRLQADEASISSLSVPFTVDPQCSSACQDNCTLNNAQLSKPSITITVKRASSTTSKCQLPDQPRDPPPNQLTSGTLSLDLGTPVKQLEDEVTKASNCRELIILSTGPNLLFSTADSESWSLEAQTLSCGK